MQRPEAKNPPERPIFTAETRNLENRRQDPRRNGPFPIDHGFSGSGGLDGGVASHVRTRLHLNSLITAVLQGIFAKNWPGSANLALISARTVKDLGANSLRSGTANIFELSGNCRAATANFSKKIRQFLNPDRDLKGRRGSDF